MTKTVLTEAQKQQKVSEQVKANLQTGSKGVQNGKATGKLHVGKGK